MSKQPIYIMKSGKAFPGSVYGKLVKALGEYGAGRALYKARNAKNPVTYILAGLKGGWIGTDTSEMDYGKQAMEAWITKNVHRQAPAPKVKVKPTKRIYKDNKLIEKISGRTSKPDTFAKIAGEIL